MRQRNAVTEASQCPNANTEPTISMTSTLPHTKAAHAHLEAQKAKAQADAMPEGNDKAIAVQQAHTATMEALNPNLSPTAKHNSFVRGGRGSRQGVGNGRCHRRRRKNRG